MAHRMFAYETVEDGVVRHHLSPLQEAFVFEHGLPANAIVGMCLSGPDVFSSDAFVANPKFLAVMHEIVALHGPAIAGIQESARRTGKGSVSVIDGRVADPNGAVKPENIVGAFEVADGQVGAYHPCPRYELVNELGPPQLPDVLHDLLVEHLASTA